MEESRGVWVWGGGGGGSGDKILTDLVSGGRRLPRQVVFHVGWSLHSAPCW